ncbi:MAG: pirin family protein, partial [Bryobacterales bacterium]|nr:pirin family protein [Bryobacterales bacterium]
PGEVLDLDLDPTHEHALLPLSGDCELEGRAIASHQLHYLGIHRKSLALSSRAGGRMILIGGPPFPERILMWWNFVARTPQEIAEARADWEDHRRFGDVRAYEGPRIPAPELMKFAQPNPLS